MPLKIPRDRDGSFSPTLVPKHSRVLEGLEDKVLALYAIGMSTRDISEQLEELYGPAISPTLVSQITDSSIPLMHEWQNRPLDPLFFLNLGVVEKNWTMILSNWSNTLNYLMLSHHERIKTLVP